MSSDTTVVSTGFENQQTTTQPAVPPASPDAGNTLSLSTQYPSGLFGLSIVNFLLKIVTLGIYTFWARTEVRKRIWSAIRLNGEPLAYTGTGKELFLGFLYVFGLFIIPVIALLTGLTIYIGDPESPILLGAQFTLYIASLYLIGVAIYASQRYILSRTTWRGIRGKLDGSPWAYGWTFFWTTLLIPLSLGWAMPWRSVKLQNIMTNNTSFGSVPLKFEAKSGPLYIPFAVIWFGAVLLYLIGVGVFVAYKDILQQSVALSGIPLEQLQVLLTLIFVVGIIFIILILNILSAWYVARTFNYFASVTQYQNATFKGSVTAGGVIWLTLSNFLITVLSLGLLTPIAQARLAHYFVKKLEINGEVDLATIEQTAKQDISHGDGLAQAFDINAI